MKIIIKDIPEEEVKADVLVVPLFEDQLPDIYAKLDLAAGNVISGAICKKDFAGKLGQTMFMHVSGIKAERLLLAGLGKRKEITHEKIRRSGAKAFSAIDSRGLSGVAVSARIFDELSADKFFMRPEFYFLEGGMLGIYHYEKYKTAAREEKTNKKIESIHVLSYDRGLDIEWLQALVSATYFARDMVNAPSNDMTPSVIARIAQKIAGKNLKVRVLERSEIEKEKMGGYLSVAKGSDEPLKFIIIEYRRGKGKPLVLIGKTITFDSGGLDIKPGEGMEKMKYDMAGGGVVLSVIKAAADLKLPLNLIAILPAAENLIGGSATRPGDVVSTITGKTVEIISTDAEGRMTLADAIGYAKKYKSPAAIIDIATLTGACNVAFGNEAISMMGTATALMDKLRAASEEAYERVWPMPLFEEYGDYLKSDIADIKNVGGRKSALCSSAYFLKEFAGETPWVHLDIAGSAWNDTERPYSPRGASGIGVRLLLNFLRRM
jgi:leucyl aminopeptidase